MDAHRVAVVREGHALDLEGRRGPVGPQFDGHDAVPGSAAAGVDGLQFVDHDGDRLNLAEDRGRERDVTADDAAGPFLLVGATRVVCHQLRCVRAVGQHGLDDADLTRSGGNGGGRLDAVGQQGRLAECLDVATEHHHRTCCEQDGEADQDGKFAGPHRVDRE
jgi:hypothetical protein